MKWNDYQQAMVLFSMSIVLIVECLIGKYSLPTMTCRLVSALSWRVFPLMQTGVFSLTSTLPNACDKCFKIPQNIIIIPSLLRQVCRWTMIAVD